MGEKTGRAKEVVGWVTGDREVEAKGRVEQDVADPATPTDDVTDAAVRDEKQAVRADHHEVDSDRR